MNKKQKILLIFIIIIMAIMGYYIYKLTNERALRIEEVSKLQNEIHSFESIEIFSENSNEILANNANTVSTSITETDVLQIATNTYKNVYNMITSADVFAFGDYIINGESKTGYKVDIKRLEKVFTEKALNQIKEHLVESNNEYYDVDMEMKLLEKIDLTTIFGNTDQGIRPITVKSYTDNLIVATG